MIIFWLFLWKRNGGVHEFFDNTLVFLSVTEGSSSSALLISAAGAQVVLMFIFFTIVLTLGIWFDELFPSVIENKRVKNKSTKYSAKCKLNGVELIILEAMQDLDTSREDYIYWWWCKITYCIFYLGSSNNWKFRYKACLYIKKLYKSLRTSYIRNIV